MKVETKLRQSLSHRKSPLVFRTDVTKLGSQTQVTHAFNQLIKSGALQRIAQGVYVKSHSKVSFDQIVKETATKLNLELVSPLRNYEPLFAQGDTVTIEIKKPRINRKVEFNGKQILFRTVAPANKTSTPLSIPKTNVAQFVIGLAKKYKISYQLSPLDIFGNAVTRLSDDRVIQDDVRDLIIALKRAGKISARELITLNTNYLHEKRQHV